MYAEYLPCLTSIGAYLEWLKETRIWKLKYESEDILFVAFQQKKTRAITTYHGLVMG
jgi:hypothetical protein